MSTLNNPNSNSAAGALGGPIINVPLLPVVANRAPGPNDTGYPIGQEWVFKNQNQVFFLTQVVAGQATWTMMAAPGGGQFVEFTVQTNGAVVSPIVTLPMAMNSAINVFCTIVGARADYSAAAGGNLQGTFRRAGAAPAEVASVPTFASDSGGLTPSATIGIVGNDVEILILGEAGQIWNWKVETIVTVLP
jgi:hypothetical protein